MEIVDRGTGDPVIVVPGIQGRWEYAAPAVDSLARRGRVITYSLDDHAAADMDAYVHQLIAVMNARGVERAAVCGISFGGLVALRVAATHPVRVSRLILASTPGPQWHLKPRHDLYARWPRVFGPIFAAESPFRLRREIAAAFESTPERLRFSGRQLSCLWRAPVSLPRMAARARMIGGYDRLSDCARIVCPTLVVHGDPSLDHVVDASGTSEYARVIPGAAERVLEYTGHLGSITRPDRFADIVREFMTESVSAPSIRQSAILQSAMSSTVPHGSAA